MSATTSLGHLPGEKWEFDERVTACFEDMLRRSVPQYDVMREAVASVARWYRQDDTEIVDLGASRGDGLEPLIEEFGAYNHWTAVEVSPPMLEVLRRRFAGYVRAGLMDILDLDLTQTFPPVEASVILSVLTLQFIPIECRQTLVQRVYDCLLPGGAFVVIEKILGDTAQLDEMMVATYYNFKQDSGYTEEEIRRKRMALRGVLVPLTAEFNNDLLRRVGFREIDCVWRWFNFAGWVAIK